MKQLAITLLLLTCSLCASAQDRLFHLPFSDQNNGIILLTMEVDGKPAVLMLDSGATTSLFKTPGLIELRVAPHDVIGLHANDLGRLNNSNTKIMAQFGIVGILGEDFLHKFKSVRIDYANHVLDLEPR